MRETPTVVPRQLRQPGWTWTPKGLQVASGGMRMLIPLPQVILIFEGCLVEEGIPNGAGVGCCASVGALFKKISRGVKKFGRKATRGIARAAKKVGKVVKNVVTHPAFRAGFAALSTAFPVLAPAAAGLEVASRVIKKVEDGAKAAKAIKRGVKSAANVAKVKDGIKAKRAIESTVRAAQSGNQLAQRAYGGLIGAKVTRRAAKRRAIRKLPASKRPRRPGVNPPFPFAR